MDAKKNRINRRDFLLAASAGALGSLAAGCSIGATEPAAVMPATEAVAATTAPKATEPLVPPAQAVEPRIDRVLRNGILKVGVDLTEYPLQFRDPDTNEPKGYMTEIDALMAQDLGVQLEYVEIPFGELISALLADKFDWIGIAFTSTPERAKSVLFIDEPVFTEDSFLLLKPGLKVENLSELDNPSVTLSNQMGAAQDASARLMFPNANFKPLQFPEYIMEVAAGRADACLTSVWSAARYIHENPGLVDIWPGGVIFADVNTFYVPSGDYKTKEWMGNWFRYYSAHRWQQTRFAYWMGQVEGFQTLMEQVSGG